MADGAVNAEQGRNRGRARAVAEGERSVRQRLDDIETRMDTEALCRAQDTRLLYLEAYTKVVLRGFSSVGDFLKDEERDFKLAKQAFIGAFVHEIREHAFAEATHVRLRLFFAKIMGWLLLASSRQEANMEPTPMGCCVSKLLVLEAASLICWPLQANIFLNRTKFFRIVFGATRWTREEGKAKGRKAKGLAKRAAAPANPQG